MEEVDCQSLLMRLASSGQRLRVHQRPGMLNLDPLVTPNMSKVQQVLYKSRHFSLIRTPPFLTRCASRLCWCWSPKVKTGAKGRLIPLDFRRGFMPLSCLGVVASNLVNFSVHSHQPTNMRIFPSCASQEPSLGGKRPQVGGFTLEIKHHCQLSLLRNWQILANQVSRGS